jgi:hypothetical protein
MANHCIDCEICGADLRSRGCLSWAQCPGWAGSGDRADLEKIAADHPLDTFRARARELQEEQARLKAEALARAEAWRKEQERHAACPGHTYRDIGGFEVAILECTLCGHQTVDYY